MREPPRRRNASTPPKKNALTNVQASAAEGSQDLFLGAAEDRVELCGFEDGDLVEELFAFLGQ